MVNMEKYTTVQCLNCGGTGKIKSINPAYLRKRREDAEIGVREFARQLGLSAAYISDVELGRRFPTAEIIHAYEKLTKK